MPESPELQKEMVRASIDFSKCQMPKILEDYQAGRPVEFESFSPYLSDYNLATGDFQKIYQENPVNTDAIGIEVAKVLRRAFPEATMISLYDEYNTVMLDSADAFGRPYELNWIKNEAPQEVRDRLLKILDEQEPDGKTKQVSLPQAIKDNFRDSIERQLQSEGVIRPGDKKDVNYKLISESEKVVEAEELVNFLDTQGLVEKGKDQQLFFKKGDAEIELRQPNGHWQCVALDASSYFKHRDENLKTTHLVVLPKSFEEQQDQVWEVLQAIGMKPTNYHNIFFDKDLPPQAVAEIIGEEIEKAKVESGQSGD